MDKSAIYHKSERGTQALATRDAALSPKHRSMLILINGKRSYAELTQLGQGLGDPAQLLAQLAEQAFIEAAAGSDDAPTEPAPVTELAVSLPQARRFAVRRLTDLLGPTAEDLCLRIESARSPQEFQAAIRRADAILRDVVGAQLAQQFTSDVEKLRP